MWQWKRHFNASDYTIDYIRKLLVTLSFKIQVILIKSLKVGLNICLLGVNESTIEAFVFFANMHGNLLHPEISSLVLEAPLVPQSLKGMGSAMMTLIMDIVSKAAKKAFDGFILLSTLFLLN